MVDQLRYFSFQPMLHNYDNKGRGMCYLSDGAYKDILLLIGKSSPCGGSGFPLSLSEWSFTICQIFRFYSVTLRHITMCNKRTSYKYIICNRK